MDIMKNSTRLCFKHFGGGFWLVFSQLIVSLVFVSFVS